MFPKTLTITVTSAVEEGMVERALAMARDLQELAQTVADGHVLDRCEEAAVDQGREFTRQALEQVIAARLASAEKKGRRSAAVAAGCSASTKVVVRGQS